MDVALSGLGLPDEDAAGLVRGWTHTLGQLRGRETLGSPLRVRRLFEERSERTADRIGQSQRHRVWRRRSLGAVRDATQLVAYTMADRLSLVPH
jgi:hypothetical protein